MSESIIICDADHPPIEGGAYFIGYCEMVDGQRHAWHDGKRVRHGRNFGHPPDPRCPECHPGPASPESEGSGGE